MSIQLILSSYSIVSRCYTMLEDTQNAILWKSRQVEVLKTNFGEEDDDHKHLAVTLPGYNV